MVNILMILWWTGYPGDDNGDDDVDVDDDGRDGATCTAAAAAYFALVAD